VEKELKYVAVIAVTLMAITSQLLTVSVQTKILTLILAAALFIYIQLIEKDTSRKR